MGCWEWNTDWPHAVQNTLPAVLAIAPSPEPHFLAGETEALSHKVNPLATCQAEYDVDFCCVSLAATGCKLIL